MGTKTGFAKAYPRTRTCLVCGQQFQANSPRHYYCHNPCISPKTRFRISMYFGVVGVRSVFKKCKERNPELAKKIKAEMLKEEGEEFTKIALNGM